MLPNFKLKVTLQNLRSQNLNTLFFEKLQEMLGTLLNTLPPANRWYFFNKEGPVSFASILYCDMY